MPNFTANLKRKERFSYRNYVMDRVNQVMKRLMVIDGTIVESSLLLNIPCQNVDHLF